MWLAIAERFKWCALTGLHWLGLDDQLQSFRIVQDLVGERYMLSAFVDGTFAKIGRAHV